MYYTYKTLVLLLLVSQVSAIRERYAECVPSKEMVSPPPDHQALRLVINL